MIPGSRQSFGPWEDRPQRKLEPDYSKQLPVIGFKPIFKKAHTAGRFLETDRPKLPGNGFCRPRNMPL
jgi:hypothetical protein